MPSNKPMLKRTQLLLVTFCGLIFFSSVLMGNNSQIPSSTSGRLVPTPSGDLLGVSIGLVDEFEDNHVEEAFLLEHTFIIRRITPAELLANLTSRTVMVDLLVLANVTYSAGIISGLQTFLKSDGGRLFLLLGNASSGQGALLATLNLATDSITTDYLKDGIWNPSNLTHVFVKEIPWSTISEIHAYTKLAWRAESINVILSASETIDPLLIESKEYFGRLIVLTPWMSKPYAEDFEMNPYYNYFFYHAVQYLAGLPAVPYTDWPYSPVPHEAEWAWILVYIVIIAAIATIGFGYARGRAKHPLQHHLLRRAAEIKMYPSQTLAGVPSKDPSVIQAQTHAPMQTPSTTNNIHHYRAKPIGSRERVIKRLHNLPSPEWEQIGLHRQISSFFYNFLLVFITSIPTLLLSLYIYPTFIVPFPQVYGWQSWTGTFFAVLFDLFNLNVNVALTKHFAQYRIKDPAKAIKFVQFYIWWRMITGVVQITIVASLTFFYFSHSSLSSLSWIFFLAAIGQFPGMLGAISLTLEGMQRFDLKVLTNVVAGTVINTAVSYGSILLCRFIFAENPIYGAAFGAAIGIAIGGFLGGWTVFVLTASVFKRLGFSIGTLFRVDFGKAEIREALTYGWKLTAGWMIVPLVGMLEAILVSQYVLDYYSSLGYYGMMSTVTGVFMTAGVFYDSIRPGIAEAYGNGKMKLLEYYTIETFRWTQILSFIPLACAIATGIPLLQGFLGHAWAPAADFLIVQSILHSLGPYAWIGDVIFQGTGKTNYNGYVWLIEQGTRAILLLILVPQMQVIVAIGYAYIAAMTAKGIGTLIIIRKKIVKFDWCLGHTVFAPTVSLVFQYLFCLLLVPLIWRGDLFTSVLLYMGALYGGWIVYMFFLGIFGGWDDNTLQEFKRGIDVIHIVRVIFAPIYHATNFGHRISPLKNRFRVKVFEDAIAEAQQLTEEKKKLVI